MTDEKIIELFFKRDEQAQPKKQRIVFVRRYFYMEDVSAIAEDMVIEGRRIERILGNNTYIKIPTIPEGLCAMQILRGEGYHVTATAIYTPMQAYLAAKAGAEYAAPYVNRIDNLGGADVLVAGSAFNGAPDRTAFVTQIEK